VYRCLFVILKSPRVDQSANLTDGELVYRRICPVYSTLQSTSNLQIIPRRPNRCFGNWEHIGSCYLWTRLLDM